MGKRVTFKQKAFVREYVQNGGNGTQAALVSYDTKDPKSASVIATENLAQLSVQQEIDDILNKNNFTLAKNLENIQKIANATVETRVTADQVLKANLEFLRARGKDVGHKTRHESLSLKADIGKLGFQELIKRHKESRAKIDALLEE